MDKLDQKKSVIITVDNIKFDYEKQSILQGISFNLKAGERVALLGRTGAGKSTLLNNLIGLKFPQKGEIIIDGLKLEKKILQTLGKILVLTFKILKIN